MATLHVEYGPVALKSPNGSSIHGNAVYYVGLAISGSQATSVAATGDQLGNVDGVARLSTDTNCFVAVGSTPDTTATVVSGTTSAKRFLAAGATITLPITRGQSVGVVAA